MLTFELSLRLFPSVNVWTVSSKILTSYKIFGTGPSTIQQTLIWKHKYVVCLPIPRSSLTVLVRILPILFSELATMWAKPCKLHKCLPLRLKVSPEHQLRPCIQWGLTINLIYSIRKLTSSHRHTTYHRHLCQGGGKSPKKFKRTLEQRSIILKVPRKILSRNTLKRLIWSSTALKPDLTNPTRVLSGVSGCLGFSAPPGLM